MCPWKKTMEVGGFFQRLPNNVVVIKDYNFLGNLEGKQKTLIYIAGFSLASKKLKVTRSLEILRFEFQFITEKLIKLKIKFQFSIFHDRLLSFYFQHFLDTCKLSKVQNNLQLCSSTFSLTSIPS